MPFFTSAVRRLLAPRPIDKREVLPFLPPDPIVVEAGAHDGSDTVGFARLWPMGQVHAFEPMPPNFQRLVDRVKDLDNVRLYRSALGTSTGQASMWVSDGGDQSSSIHAPKAHLEVFPEITFGRQTEVPITTLDAWSEREGIERVDFLWLDMQGHELAALRHAAKVLPTVRAMVIEVFVKELYEGSPLWPEVREWLAGQGFVVRREVIGPAFGDVLVTR